MPIRSQPYRSPYSGIWHPTTSGVQKMGTAKLPTATKSSSSSSGSSSSRHSTTTTKTQKQLIASYVSKHVKKYHFREPGIVGAGPNAGQPYFIMPKPKSYPETSFAGGTLGGGATKYVYTGATTPRSKPGATTTRKHPLQQADKTELGHTSTPFHEAQPGLSAPTPHRHFNTTKP